ncbi:Hypothetical predicted protein [Cloeon dipterum]|uniref:Uncharacterized protein n=1 Tax=Cloeon dipterum TaxID=197152 RepID=A0A8S1CJI1_9INSE|nr:Hypothetical predicted protein [Cloeon dipterum]
MSNIIFCKQFLQFTIQKQPSSFKRQLSKFSMRAIPHKSVGRGNNHLREDMAQVSLAVNIDQNGLPARRCDMGSPESDALYQISRRTNESLQMSTGMIHFSTGITFLDCPSK